MDEEWSLNAMKQFILDFEDGKLETYVKSEPVQEDDGHVKVAVGKNIDDIINEPGKDVFIEAYAPWCMFLVFFNLVCIDSLTRMLRRPLQIACGICCLDLAHLFLIMMTAQMV